MIQLFRGNCLDVMKRIPDGVIDFVLTDPPYGVTACKWDSVIPFAPMWEQVHRVARRNAAIALFCLQPFTSALVMSNVERFRYEWVWKKNAAGGFAQAKNKPLSQHESVAIFSYGKTGHVSQCARRVPYYPQGLVPFGKVVANRQQHRASAFEARRGAKSSYVQEFTGYPNSVLEFACERGGLHPTQKPVALLEYLIRTYTLPGETVLDFTMGSGSTGVAAINTGRSFIGIELNQDYFAIAEKRLGEIYDDAPLAGYPKQEQQK